jgi:4-aminobutyrate aminotransferase-like enzyme
MSTETVLKLRQHYLGRNLGLAYQQPLHIVRGAGQYLFDSSGRKFLDAVNNVCHVGHCHPRVVAAGHMQMAQLNTNTRYLHENIVRYAERLTRTLPPTLEVCFFVNSGSEANELALRLASAHTQRHEWLVMDHGYYGNTSTLINLSPYKFNGKGGNGKPDHVHVLPQPDSLRHRDAFAIPPVSDKIAALLCEAMPSCGGQVVLPAQYLQRVYAEVREAGGVCIADEIQTGLGRLGTHFWAFATQDVVPDIVTIGKPLGNGHPIGAVVTTRAIAESFCNGMEYFNTFGGNPVSCAIGLAVLDVIADENLQTHAMAAGNHLKQQLQALMTKHKVIGDVRGTGLFLGIELVTDRSTLNPAPELATAIVDHMLKQQILLSVDGPSQNVIKIKPPLVFSKENGDELAAHLDAALLK